MQECEPGMPASRTVQTPAGQLFSVMLYIPEHTDNDRRVSLQCDNILSRRRSSTHFACSWIDLMLDTRISDPGLSTCNRMRNQMMGSRGSLARFRSSRD